MKFSKTSVLAAAILSISISVIAQETTGLEITNIPKKIISGGREFGLQRPVDFPEIVKQLEDGPYDGISLGFEAVSSEDSTIKASMGNAWRNVKWKKEWFKKDAELLKNTPKGKLTDNFIRVYISTAYGSKDSAADRLEWDNDEQWASFTNNLGVLAWYVKEAGFKGLMLDPEDYAKPEVKQYSWLPTDGDYKTTCKLARKRGGEMMSAMVKEYPDITLFFYWLISLRMNLLLSENTDIATAHNKDLWIPFVNGMLDAATPQTIIIDGYENYFLQGAEFNKHYELIKNRALNLVVPENREKYRDQVLYCPPLYMASFISDESFPYYLPPLNGSRSLRFLNNLTDALDVTDKYVWIWSEDGMIRDWKPQNGKLKDYNLFETFLPGTENIMKLAKTPMEQGKAELKELKAQGKAINLAKNSDMSKAGTSTSAAGGVPAGYTTYKNSGSKGTFSQDNTTGYNDKFSAKAAGANGGFIQTIPVKPFEWYVVEVLGKKTGGNISATIRWKTADGKWLKAYDDVDFYFIENAENGWNKATGTARVPEGAGNMVVLLSMSDQSPADICWFDDLGIYQIR